MIQDFAFIVAWGKKATFCYPTIGFSAKWHPRSNKKISILMMYHLPYLGSAFDWLKQTFNKSKALPRPVWVATPHQNGISLIVPQKSFCRETHGCIVKWYLLSQRLKSESNKIILSRLSQKAKRLKKRLQIQFPLSVIPIH